MSLNKPTEPSAPALPSGLCLWCEELPPVPGRKLCATCQQGWDASQPHEDGSYCPKCYCPVCNQFLGSAHNASCTACASAVAYRERVHGPIIADLRAILRTFLREDYLPRRPWRGAEFGKAIFAGSVLGALEHHNCDPQAELRAAMHDVRG